MTSSIFQPWNHSRKTSLCFKVFLGSSRILFMWEKIILSCQPLHKEDSAHLQCGRLSLWGLPWWLRESRICLQHGRPGFDNIPGLGISLEERNGYPLQYSCLENPHGQKSLAGYSLHGRKESDRTERLRQQTVAYGNVWFLDEFS